MISFSAVWPPLWTWLLVVAWLGGELSLLLLRRPKNAQARRLDRGSFWVLSVLLTLGLACALGAVVFSVGSLPWAAPWALGLGLLFLGSGGALRWAAIRQLGRYFTVRVSVEDGQHLVQDGLYRYLRHPSYLGLFLQFFGFGVLLSNAVSVLAVAVPLAVAIAYRIRAEEAALQAAFGSAYDEFRRSRWAVFPLIY